MFVSVVHPVAILSAVFCVICSLLMFVSDASGDHMMETYLSMGLVMLSICSSSCVLYFAEFGVKRVHGGLSGLRMRLLSVSCISCRYDWI